MAAGGGQHSAALDIVIRAVSQNVEQVEQMRGKIQGLHEEVGKAQSAIGGWGIASLAAGVAVGGLTAAVKDAFDGYMKFGEEVHNVQRVTGASATESSKLVDVFQQLGIDSDKADRALLKMNETMVKSGTANADVTKSLGEVADRYVAAGTAAERDAIAYEAFGRQAIAMIPLLEQGSAGLKAMEDASGRTISQEDIERVHKLSIEQRALGQEVDHVKDMFGEQVTKGLLPWFDLVTGGSAKTRDFAASQGDLAEQNKALERAIRDATKAQEDQLKADTDAISASLAKEHADLGVSDALKRLKDDTERYGASSEQATRDTFALKEAMVRDAEAAAKLAEDHAKAAGQVLSARDKANLLIDALRAEERQLAPDSPLHKALDEYIAQLGNIPRDINTRLTLTSASDVTGYQNPGRQHGGPVMPGGTYTVGERGPETLVMGSGGGGYVIPHAGGGGGGSMTIDIPVILDGEVIARVIDRRVSRLSTAT